MCGIYLNEYQGRFNAKLEVGSVPKCFNSCINDIEGGPAGLTSVEKNCMRECYLKRVSSRDDLNLMVLQKIGIDTIKSTRDLTV